MLSAYYVYYYDLCIGKIATALVREFLHFFDLDYTCSVFDPETNAVCSNGEVCSFDHDYGY